MEGLRLLRDEVSEPPVNPLVVGKALIGMEGLRRGESRRNGLGKQGDFGGVGKALIGMEGLRLIKLGYCSCQSLISRKSPDRYGGIETLGSSLRSR